MSDRKVWHSPYCHFRGNFMKQTEFCNNEHRIVKDRLDYLDDKVINIEYKTIDTATKVA